MGHHPSKGRVVEAVQLSHPVAGRSTELKVLSVLHVTEWDHDSSIVPLLITV